MNIKVKETGQVIPVQKEIAKMILDKSDGTITYTSRGKMKNFRNKQAKKDKNFKFLQTCIAKGCKIVQDWENNPNFVMPMHAIRNNTKLPYMGVRNLFGIKLDNEQG